MVTATAATQLFPGLLIFGAGFRIRLGHSWWDTQDLALLSIPLITLILAIWCLARANRKQDGRPYYQPRGLFLELCTAPQLPLGSRWLLWRLARQLRLRRASQLFVDPHWFAADGLRGRLAKRMPELLQLREQLFGHQPLVQLGEIAASPSVVRE